MSNALLIATIKKDEVIDLTEEIVSLIQDAKKEEGVCVIFTAHTTCAITTADLDPGTDIDLLETLRRLLPHMNYRHPHDPKHTPDHILSSIIGPSLIIPFSDRKLQLGAWQRIIMVELDGPRERTVHVTLHYQ